MSEICSYICNEVVADCASLNKPGGITSKVFVGSRKKNPLILSPVSGKVVEIGNVDLEDWQTIDIIGAQGKTRQHNTTAEGGVNDGGFNTVNQTTNLVLYPKDQVSRDAISDMIRADDLWVITINNDGVAYAHGVNFGLRGSNLAGGSGTQIGDPTSITVTLTGEELGLPVIVDKSTIINQAGVTVASYLNPTNDDFIAAMDVFAAAGQPFAINGNSSTLGMSLDTDGILTVVFGKSTENAITAAEVVITGTDAETNGRYVISVSDIAYPLYNTATFATGWGGSGDVRVSLSFAVGCKRYILDAVINVPA